MSFDIIAGVGAGLHDAELADLRRQVSVMRDVERIRVEALADRDRAAAELVRARETNAEARDVLASARATRAGVACVRCAARVAGIITVQGIQAAVAKRCNVSIRAINSRVRTRVVVRARMIAMYMTRDLLRLSYPEIGSRFGGRDHATAMHAIRRVGGMLETDDGIASIVVAVRRALAGEPGGVVSCAA